MDEVKFLVARLGIRVKCRWRHVMGCWHLAATLTEEQGTVLGHMIGDSAARWFSFVSRGSGEFCPNYHSSDILVCSGQQAARLLKLCKRYGVEDMRRWESCAQPPHFPRSLSDGF